MQVLYSLTLEWRMARGAQEWGLDAGRLPTGGQVGSSWSYGALGYQDDQYLFGRAVDLARALPQLDACLAQDGHRVRRDKCSIWNPAMDIPEIADQMSAGDTRHALTELARGHAEIGCQGNRAGDAEACGKGTHAGGQGDRVQQGIRMPKTSAYGLDSVG